MARVDLLPARGGMKIYDIAFCMYFSVCISIMNTIMVLLHSLSSRTNINHKGLQRTANEYAEERRIYKDLISKNNNVDILNSASIILQC